MTPDDRYRMFEVNMDEYLEEETEYIKQALDTICRSWDQQVRPPPVLTDGSSTRMHPHRPVPPF
jgi:recyclin-1